MKDNFFVRIETIHLNNDRGNNENVRNEGEIVMHLNWAIFSGNSKIMIFNHDFSGSLFAKRFIGQKGRGAH